jgi:hypothetical protein
MTRSRWKYVYIGPSTLWGLRKGMPVRRRAHPPGTYRLERMSLQRIETESGDVWRVPRRQVVERDLAALILRDGVRD